jgi:hypothetical protein
VPVAGGTSNAMKRRPQCQSDMEEFFARLAVILAKAYSTALARRRVFTQARPY